jgi:hypothetical protein
LAEKNLDAKLSHVQNRNSPEQYTNPATAPSPSRSRATYEGIHTGLKAFSFSIVKSSSFLPTGSWGPNTDPVVTLLLLLLLLPLPLLLETMLPFSSTCTPNMAKHRKIISDAPQVISKPHR